MRAERSRRVAAGLCALAAVYSAGLLVSIAAVPTIDDQTLLEYGGPWSFAIFAQPLLMSVVMWQLLRGRCHTGSDQATVGAWMIAIVYLVYSVLGGFTVAAGALPAALLIFFAVALTPRGATTNA